MKKKLIIPLSVMAILLIGAGIYFFPRPMIKDPENTSILSVEYNPNFGQDKLNLTKITNYDRQEILQCIGQYKVSPSLSRSKGYSISDTQLILVLQDGEEMHTILLGNINYYDGTYGEPRFLIQNAEDLRKDLLQILNIQE